MQNNKKVKGWNEKKNTWNTSIFSLLVPWAKVSFDIVNSLLSNNLYYLFITSSNPMQATWNSFSSNVVMWIPVASSMVSFTRKEGNLALFFSIFHNLAKSSQMTWLLKFFLTNPIQKLVKFWPILVEAKFGFFYAILSSHWGSSFEILY